MSLMHSGSPSHAIANSDSNNLHPSIPCNDVNIPTLLAGALMPVLVYAIFGSSRELSVGPVAVTSLLTAAALKVFSERELEVIVKEAMTAARDRSVELG